MILWLISVDLLVDVCSERFAVKIQAIFFITIRPFSRNMYRRINRVMVELLWLQLVWLFDWWAAIEVFLQKRTQNHSNTCIVCFGNAQVTYSYFPLLYLIT